MKAWIIALVIVVAAALAPMIVNNISNAYDSAKDYVTSQQQQDNTNSENNTEVEAA